MEYFGYYQCIITCTLQSLFYPFGLKNCIGLKMCCTAAIVLHCHLLAKL